MLTADYCHVFKLFLLIPPQISDKYARRSAQTASEWVRGNSGGNLEEISGQKNAIGGRRLQLPDIVKICTSVTSLRRTFICVDALDECVPRHRLEVPGALGQILRGSPNTRVFITGRPHTRGMVERQLGGRTLIISIVSREDDIVRYLHARLEKDTTPEEIDSFLENDIINSILEKLSETYVPGRVPRNPCESCTNKSNTDSY